MGDRDAVLREQRRRVLAALADEERIDASPVVRATEVLSAAEHVTLVYELHHVHLPALEAAGLVTFDRSAGEVSRGPRFDQRAALPSRDER